MCDFSGFKYVFTCGVCEKDFGANRSDKKYCSRPCKDSADRSRNIESIRARVREYRIKNKEAIKERQAKYYQNNKDRLDDENRKYRRANPDIIKCMSLKSYEKNKNNRLIKNKEWR